MISETNNKQSIWLNDKKVITIVLVVIGFTIGIAGMLSPLTELSNNVTLVVEIGVGIIIAIIVFRSTKKSENQNQITLDEMKNYVKEIHLIEQIQQQKDNEQFQQIRKKQNDAFIEMFNSTMLMATFINSILISWENQLQIDVQTRKNNFYVELAAFEYEYKRYLKLIEIYGEILDPSLIQSLHFMHSIIDNNIEFLKKDFSNKDRVIHLQTGITGIQKILEPKIPHDSEFYKKNIEPHKNKN